jgi:hypothetical protein
VTTITTDWLPFANVSQDDTGTAWDRLANFNSQAAFDSNNNNTFSQANSVDAGGLTRRVRLWGITLPGSVPSNAALVGIEVRVWNAQAASSFADDTRRLMNGTTEVGNNLALAGNYTSFLSNGSDRVSGGPASLWGTSLTKSDLGANFGFRFRAVNAGSKSGQVYAARAAVRFTFETPITATLAATETGSDTFIGSGAVSWPSLSGALAATETGADIASGFAQVGVSGTLSAQETGQDTAAVSASAFVFTTLATTETGSDTASGVAGVTVSAALSASETGADGFSGAVVVSITASVAATETGDDTGAATASVSVSGVLSVAEAGSDTTSVSAAVSVSGVLSVAEAGSDTTSVSAAVSVSGAMDATETGSDIFSASAFVTAEGRVAVFTAVETGEDQAAGAAIVSIAAQLSAFEVGDDTFFGLIGDATATTGPLSGVILRPEQAGGNCAQVIFDGVLTSQGRKYVTGGFWRRS